MKNSKELDRIESVIEAVLFTMGNSVQLSEIARVVEHDEETTRKIIHNLMDKYSSAHRGIRIVELENSFQMCSSPEYYEELIKIASEPKKHVLTDVLLETLSIVAYKQPITKADIESIRGVNSDHSINKLLEYGLIEEVGRKNAPGRPCLFGTSEEFLRHFGISSIDELPVITPEKMEEFKSEAEDEMQLKLDI